jgi:hypothetical protein
MKESDTMTRPLFEWRANSATAGSIVLSLEDAELDIVLAAARPLPVELRSEFLEAVAAALEGREVASASCIVWPMSCSVPFSRRDGARGRNTTSQILGEAGLR